MLKGISPLISPDLLAVLARMGHGNEIVLADAHFPGETFNACVLQADGIKNAFAVIMTGDTAKYGNIIFKKGVTPVF